LDGESMKAIRVSQFGPPEVMVVGEQPDPVAGPGQVLVKVRFAGVNPVDTYIRAGAYATKPALPYTPGGDGAGEVIAVGPGVTGIATGARVFFCGTSSGNNAGGYADRALCAAGQVHPLPDRLTFEQGAGIGVPYLAAYRGLIERGEAKLGDWVLIHGATGAVGIAAVQLALAAGCRVIGSGSTAEGQEMLARQGVRHVVNHHEAVHFQQVMEITNGRGVDVILEMLANKNLEGDMTVAARRGRIVIIGSRGKIEIDPRGTMARRLDIRGVASFDATVEEFATTWTAIGAGLDEGKLTPLVGRTFPLAEAPQAHRAVMDGPALGKIVLLP
jgi:NADPH:quinone reductase